MIPEAYREALELRPGDEVLLRLEGDELCLASVRGALARARRLVRRYVPGNEDQTQSLIDDRRRETELE